MVPPQLFRSRDSMFDLICSTCVSHSRVCRDQFISLHSYPILEELSQHFISNFVELPVHLRQTEAGNIKNSKNEDRREDKISLEREKRRVLFEAVPEKGDLDLGVVHGSTYFFS